MSSRDFGLYVCVLTLAAFVGTDRVAVAQRTDVNAEVSRFHSPEQLISFADFLYTRGEYDRAATEYQRYLFSGATVRAGFARFRIGLCRLNMQRPGESIEFFRAVALNSPASATRDSAATAWAAAALLEASDHDFSNTLALARPLVGSEPLGSRLNAFEVLSLLRASDWDGAEQTIDSFRPVGLPSVIDSSLTRLAVRGKTLPHRSPALGAVLSTLVPGLGKVYAGRPSDGIMSFVLIGGQAWLSYEGFREHGVKSFKGWFFGVVGFSFYAGNIYGSKVAVSLYNKKYTDLLDSEISTHISLSTRF